MFKGTFTALITPMNTDGSVDHSALKVLVEEQITSGISGLVPMGSTGESPTFTHAEHIEVIAQVVELVKGRVPVIAGDGLQRHPRSPGSHQEGQGSRGGWIPSGSALLQ
jgi:4-hydroxy-tetrahydrodipicolinate synthase